MGTSVNLSSPKTTAWKAVSTGYTSDIPSQRVLTEVWRASQAESNFIRDAMESELLFKCYKAVRDSGSAGKALEGVNKSLFESKQNSIVGEFAKRAVINSFKSEAPSREWTSQVFSEITHYFVSRDICGYIGENYRNKTVGDQILFKQEIRKNASNVIRTIMKEPTSYSEWKGLINVAVKKLTGTE